MLDMFSYLHAVDDAKAPSKQKFKKSEEIIRILDNVFQVCRYRNFVHLATTLQNFVRVTITLFSQLHEYHHKKK